MNETNIGVRVGATPEALPAPEGWKRVPIEPTMEMMHAGSRAADGYGTPLTRTANAYKAMLAVAPDAAGEGGVSRTEPALTDTNAEGVLRSILYIAEDDKRGWSDWAWVAQMCRAALVSTKGQST